MKSDANVAVDRFLEIGRRHSFSNNAVNNLSLNILVKWVTKNRGIPKPPQKNASISRPVIVYTIQLLYQLGRFKLIDDDHCSS